MAHAVSNTWRAVCDEAVPSRCVPLALIKVEKPSLILFTEIPATVSPPLFCKAHVSPSANPHYIPVLRIQPNVAADEKIEPAPMHPECSKGASKSHLCGPGPSRGPSIGYLSTWSPSSRHETWFLSPRIDFWPYEGPGEASVRVIRRVKGLRLPTSPRMPAGQPKGLNKPMGEIEP